MLYGSEIVDYIKQGKNRLFHLLCCHGHCAIYDPIFNHESFQQKVCNLESSLQNTHVMLLSSLHF